MAQNGAKALTRGTNGCYYKAVAQTVPRRRSNART
nr:MAG TPA: hypothetical protein [Caudoviricetes sp.]